MTRYDDHDADRTAALLAQALAEEAALVDPEPGGLQAIQRRTAATPRRSRRQPWVLGAVGAGVATAAVITTVVVVGHNGDPGRAPTPAAGTGTVQQSTGTAQPWAMHPGAYDPNAPAGSQITVYYVGPQPDNARLGPRLYAETHTVAPSGVPADVAAVREFLTSTPIDPDYSSGWPAGVDVVAITDASGISTIDLTGPTDLGTRDQGRRVDADFPVDPGAAIQALLATAGVEGAAAFTYNGHHLDRLFYQDVSPSVARESEDESRAFITIDNIVDGQTMTNPVTVLVSGNTFEGNVNWQLLDASGNKVDDGFVTTSMGTWTQVPVHLGTLDPGTYTFKALEYSAEDGSPINVDDKTFTVE